MTQWTPLPRVGRDVDATTYWRNRARDYEDEFGGSYHAHRLDVVSHVLDRVDVAARLCVDLGCGEGVHVEELARRGADVVGFDPAEELVASAAARMQRAALPARIERGGVEALEQFAGGTVDLLLAINVLHYFEDREEERFYREAGRVLMPGGSLVVVHSNELFDLFTLNRYTVEFHARHFGVEPHAVATLLTRPNEPDRTTFNVRENPLTYAHKLARLGFDEVDQEFANFHPAQPLLMDPRDHADVNRRSYPRTLGWGDEDRWKLFFTCSMFVSRSTRR